jgi:hypothetical protein
MAGIVSFHLVLPGLGEPFNVRDFRGYLWQADSNLDVALPGEIFSNNTKIVIPFPG